MKNVQKVFDEKFQRAARFREMVPTILRIAAEMGIRDPDRIGAGDLSWIGVRRGDKYKTCLGRIDGGIYYLGDYPVFSAEKYSVELTAPADLERICREFFTELKGAL